MDLGKVDGIRTVLEAVPDSMSAHAGVIMVAATERKFGLLNELCSVVNDPRSQHLVEHKMLDILMQRACQIAAGHIDCNDADWLRGDPSILAALDRHPVTGRPGASQETISRFEANAINEQNLESVQNVFVDHYLKCNKKRPKQIVLDIDGMAFTTHGAQEGAIYRGGKYKKEMYFPLMMFINKWLVAATLRFGDKGESTTVLAELTKVVARIREQWPNVPIVVRMDAAFGSAELPLVSREVYRLSAGVDTKQGIGTVYKTVCRRGGEEIS